MTSSECPDQRRLANACASIVKRMCLCQVLEGRNSGITSDGIVLIWRYKVGLRAWTGDHPAGHLKLSRFIDRVPQPPEALETRKLAFCFKSLHTGTLC